MGNKLVSALAIVALTGATIFGSGCSMTFGGYKPNDMSNSPNASKMMEKADELASSGNLQDKKTAAELYGQLGKIDGALEKMDKCVLYFFDKKSDYEGQLLLERRDKVFEFYKR